MRMCGYGASRHTMGGGLSPSGKVDSLSSRNQGVVLVQSSSREKMPCNPRTLVSIAVAATLAIVFQVCCTSARVGAGCKVGVPCACDGAVGKAGAGAGGNVLAPCCMVLIFTAWQAYVGTYLSKAMCQKHDW